MNTVRYLDLDMVIAIHDDMVERYGGSHGVRDLNLIQSALARPQASFAGQDLYPTIIDKAAALFHSLLFNHAFIDGNKRTAITSMARFLYMNGYDLVTSDKEFVSFPLRAENKHLDIEEIASWIDKHAKKAQNEGKT